MPVPFSGLTGAGLASAYLSLSESRYDGGLEQAAHGHDPAYLTCVIEGTYEERVGRTHRAVSAGALLFHPSGEEHAVRFTAPHTRIFRLEPRAHMLSELRLAGADLARVSVPARVARAADVVRQLRQAWHQRDALTPLDVDALACELIACATALPRRRGAVDSSAVRRVRERLDACAGDAPSLERLAAEVGCHPVTLARAFRRMVGRSIGAYARHQRLALAIRMLRADGAPISQVALRAGFADQAHATRALRDATGLTPGGIRKLARGA